MESSTEGIVVEGENQNNNEQSQPLSTQLNSKEPQKENTIENHKSGKSKRLFSQYSLSQQCRIRKDLHSTLENMAGAADEIPGLLQSYFTSSNHGKKVYAQLELARQSHKLEQLLPTIRSSIESDPAKKRFYISLFRKSNFTKQETENALGMVCSHNLWKSVGEEENLADIPSDDELSTSPKKPAKKRHKKDSNPVTVERLNLQPENENLQ